MVEMHPDNVNRFFSLVNYCFSNCVHACRYRLVSRQITVYKLDYRHVSECCSGWTQTKGKCVSESCAHSLIDFVVIFLVYLQKMVDGPFLVRGRLAAPVVAKGLHHVSVTAAILLRRTEERTALGRMKKRKIVRKDRVQVLCSTGNILVRVVN